MPHRTPRVVRLIRRPGLGVILLGLVLVSCGDDGARPVVPEVTSIQLDPALVELDALGASTVVAARVLDQEGAPIGGVALAWSSDDPSVAAVSAEGRVTAAGNGATSIRASAGDVEASLPVTVAQRVASLSIVADSLVLRDPGDTVTVAALVRDPGGTDVAGAEVVWTSGDTSVARISSAGLLEAAATGTTLVRATAGEYSDTLRVRVRPALALTTDGPLAFTAEVGVEVALDGRVEDAIGGAVQGEIVSWTVASASGTITTAAETESDAAGAVSAVWELGTVPGTQRAFATLLTHGETLTLEFVADVVPGDPVAATLAADTVLLSGRAETALLLPAYVDQYGNATGGSGVSWLSRDPGVVSVTGDGLLTADAEGSAWVVASMDGPTDSILVTVEWRGAITITFDDGFVSVFENAWPIFQEFDLPANIAVNPVPVDLGWSGYLTPAMLDELDAAGWSVVSHSLEHDSLPSLSPSELDYDLRTSQQWIIDRGYRGWNVFVAPYHAYGPAERAAVAQYYDASRGVSSSQFVPDSLVSWMPDDPHQLTAREADLLPYTTATGRDELRTLLQRTIDEGAFLDIFFHQVPEQNVEALRALLVVIEEFRPRVLPYHELFPVLARTVY
jgi:peptidoglycan/xylan/chitin deacetylase (PgdA/CDA1 family)